MERDKLYKQNDLSLVKLGAILNVKPYVISNVLNEYQGKTFPEFINAYRIKEAQKLLQSEKHSIYSIEAIAFDCGFNTPSAFYSYFKKITKLTPSQYRAGLK
jgi:AraC-like DNA-binding protein